MTSKYLDSSRVDHLKVDWGCTVGAKHLGPIPFPGGLLPEIVAPEAARSGIDPEKFERALHCALRRSGEGDGCASKLAGVGSHNARVRVSALSGIMRDQKWLGDSCPTILDGS